MDEETIKKVKQLLDKAANKHKLNLERVILFGSRATERYRNESDVDILIVSSDFAEVAWNKRSGPFYEEWNYETMPVPEFICLTPEEFAKKKEKKPNIVRTAIETGVQIN